MLYSPPIRGAIMKMARAGVLLLPLLVAGSRSALAQVDFSGEWAPRFHEDQPERVPGPPLGDYLGLPINDAARLRADSWDASMMTLPEWQCRPHSADYIWRGPSQLTVTVTHLKEGYIRRNGMPRSDKATVTEHWIRHGDFLTIATIVNDPVYLTEPFIRTTDYQLDLHQHVPPYPCEMVQEIERPKGVVPHHLFGTNKDVNSFGERYGLPFEATRGGAETSYPDYRKKLKQWMGPTPTAKFPGEVN